MQFTEVKPGNREEEPVWIKEVPSRAIGLRYPITNSEALNLEHRNPNPNEIIALSEVQPPNPNVRS